MAVGQAFGATFETLRPVHVDGVGLSTIERLEERGFIEATSDGFGSDDHRITPAGEAEWLRLAAR